MTAIDRGNEWNGSVKMFWSVDQAKMGAGTTDIYFAFTKIGAYPYGPPEEVRGCGSDAAVRGACGSGAAVPAEAGMGVAAPQPSAHTCIAAGLSCGGAVASSAACALNGIGIAVAAS